ncbi:hypothetical protein OU787_25995 [Kitasatospora sp. YST-16]|uniref:hypothetical protein n=1 Tax=Kitasatospora sp. YST-16 TaxID=2998080 RepID=UPI0022840250|nr:hypothetical protein [Kitasatospora sp. YST-16]WAL74640.1 hypothetical protein OU787_25995 [Kitasatospora sp. YST-16]WNW40698.1 hypothetical protein RKE32_25930 [Streptomyces sp. Li-HN-5-13]
MDSAPPSGAPARRTPISPHPLRRALFDTSALTSDVIAAAKRGQPSSLEAAAAKGTVRAYIPAHVLEEVPRVLGDRSTEGGAFDLKLVLRIWRERYLPHLYVVTADGLPMTPEAAVLEREDPSDTAMLLLAGVIAPVVIIAEDKDLLRSKLAYEDWRKLRAALGKVGVVEGKTRDYTETAATLVTLTGYGVAGIARIVAKAPALAVGTATAATLATALYLRRHPKVPPGAERAGLWRALWDDLEPKLTEAFDRHSQGEQLWSEAERGTPGESLLHRVARLLAEAPEPLTRTRIVEEIGTGGSGHRARMAEVLDVLTRYPAFCEIRRGHWQLGRRGTID